VPVNESCTVCLRKLSDYALLCRQFAHVRAAIALQAPELLQRSHDGGDGSACDAAGNSTVGDAAKTVRPYSSAVDVWSLGVFTYRVLIGAMPFPHGAPTSALPAAAVSASAALSGGASPQRASGMRVPRYLSTLAASFIQTALALDPAARPTAASLLRHPWLASCGCIVPVDLAAPEWAGLRVAPEGAPPGRCGSASELLPCPQGVDQAQYDGLYRPRFQRAGFHPADIAASGAALPPSAPSSSSSSLSGCGARLLHTAVRSEPRALQQTLCKSCRDAGTAIAPRSGAQPRAVHAGIHGRLRVCPLCVTCIVLHRTLRRVWRMAAAQTSPCLWCALAYDCTSLSACELGSCRTWA
jgi:Protein kinase domain